MNAPQLASAIHDYFNLAEIGSLCFTLGINKEDIAGDIVTEKAENLVAYCQRHNRMPDLISELKASRPTVPWVYDEPSTEQHIEIETKPTQNETNVLKYKEPPSSHLPQSKTTKRGTVFSEKPVVIGDPNSQAIAEIARYLMSGLHSQYNPNWFLSHREVMETSYTEISAVANHVELLVHRPEMAQDAAESCQQLSLQAMDLLQLLKQIGIGPNSPHPKRDLHNNLYLVDERAGKAAEQLKLLVDSFYAGSSPGNLPTEIRLQFQGLQASTEYTLRWLDRAIEQLDARTPQ